MRNTEITSQEKRVAQMAANGIPTKAIAASIKLSHRTVESIIMRICQKVNATNRTHAVAILLRRKIII